MKVLFDIKYLYSFLISFISTIFFLELLIKQSQFLGLIDKPGYRKIHNKLLVISKFKFVIGGSTSAYER